MAGCRLSGIIKNILQNRWALLGLGLLNNWLITRGLLVRNKVAAKKIYEKKLWLSQRENCISAIRFYFRAVSKSIVLPKISRFINKYFYRLGFGSSINRYDNSFTIYSAKQDKNLYTDFGPTERFINFGSGAFFHKRWINYDYPGQSIYYQNLQGLQGKDFHAIDLCEDRLRIPEDDMSVSLIYCSHTLEHLDKKSSERFLSECFRILRNNGILRLALPNTKNDFHLLHCLRSQAGANESIINSYTRDATSHILSDTQKMELTEINQILQSSNFKSNSFYKKVISEYSQYGEFDGNNPERHINYWDFIELINTTSKIGFSFTLPTYHGSSVSSPFTNLHVFDTTEPHIAFYADIIK